jgi:predicted ATPase
LTEVYLKDDRVTDGLRTLDEALAMVQKNEERNYDAELYRLKGELTLRFPIPRVESGGQQEAEDCFQTAIAVAQQQEAKAWELRAAMSLAQLWHQKGKTVEARELLTSVYDWFTEGFDTADLKDAKALLDELSI